MPRAHFEVEVPRWRVRVFEIAALTAGAVVTLGGWISEAGLALGGAATDWILSDVPVRGGDRGDWMHMDLRADRREWKKD